MRQRITPRIVPLAVSTLVVLTLMVPAAYFSFPHLYRWRMLEALHSDDDARRARALGYVAAFAETDPAVLRGAVRRLATDDPRQFHDLVAALQVAQRWDRSTVGSDAWLRWVMETVNSPLPQVRVAASNLLAELTDLADDPRVLLAVEELIDDQDADVRFNALFVAAELWAAGSQSPAIERMIGQLTADTEPIIARHAWLFLGLMDPVHGFVANWQVVPTEVAQAVLLAATLTNPGQPRPALVAFHGDDADRAAAAAYALAFAETGPDGHTLSMVVGDLGSAEPPTVRRWRAILGAPDTQPIVHLLPHLFERDGDGWEPLILAALHRLADPQAVGDAAHEGYWLRMLAALEGAVPRSIDLSIDIDTPPLVRIAAVRASREARPRDLIPVFQSPFATLRDLACVVAVERFDREELDELIRELILDYNDDAKKSGAVLAGLTGLQQPLLRQRHAVENMPQVRVVMRASLWMAGDADILDRDAALSLLTRDDLEVGSTILLSMLHVGATRDPATARVALDFLLRPRGEPGVDLPALLDQLRWWPILDHYLDRLLPVKPDTPVATSRRLLRGLWLWADPDLQQLQIDLIRSAYLLNRHALDG